MLPLMFLFAGCQRQESREKGSLPVKVKMMKATTGEASCEAYSGTVEGENTVPLSFPMAGTVQALHIHLGQQVRQGQLVATLDSLSSASAYSAARATLEQAEDAYRRMKELHGKGSLPDIKWVEVQSRVEQARSMEQIAAKNLKDCKLYAPLSGIVAEKNIEVGQNVLPGTPVARLVTASALKVKIAVPEAEIATVPIGQKASVVAPALEGKAFTAYVAEKGVVANPLSRSYDVKLKVEGSHAELLPGMVVDVALPSGMNGNAFCIVPPHIVQLDEKNNAFVWIVRDGKAYKQEISCGEYQADGVAVLSGLSPNDSIIMEGQQKVCEGTEVTL